ncbi:MAG: peptidoglycan-binding domain-containing protein [Chthoniobacter sp.]|uniref:peptidoglycan-binding domain-containing protein n=1 Tax=Chthoniobacter sp. TaxID=2510640 RepID=UPI0032A9E3B8
MNRIFHLGLVAASCVLLAQPMYAKDDKKGDDKKDGGGGKKGDGGKHASAPKDHGGGAPKSADKKASAPHSVAKSPQQYHDKKSAPVTQSRPHADRVPGVSRTKSFTQPQQHHAPSVVSGGGTNQYSHVPVNAQNSRSSAGNHGRTGNYQPSVEVSRSWDRRRSHTWNQHHYRWNDGNWVIFETGAYDYPYGYDNGYNSRRIYASQSLAVSVQLRLSRQGYNPGPADGVIGGQTRRAIADFQIDHRLPVNGEIDDTLLQAMGLN